MSPRPHDTGLVTLISQDYSEFALHARAILGLPVHTPTQLGPCASHAILATGNNSDGFSVSGLEHALALPHTSVRLFGKPEIEGKRRVGVALAMATDTDEARAKAKAVCDAIRFEGDGVDPEPMCLESVEGLKQQPVPQQPTTTGTQEAFGYYPFR